jgi:hypothetical protein
MRADEIETAIDRAEAKRPELANRLPRCAPVMAVLGVRRNIV